MEKELRILIVEDVPTDAELEVRELKRAGLRVAHRIIETEEAFRSALKEFMPEIILSDFSMPHFDGMFALALAYELVPDVPFIFVSGTIGEEYAIRALKNGATDYVLKNNLVRLPAAVERALQDKEARVARKRAEQDQGRLAAIVENSYDAIISRDLDRKITSWNTAAEHMFGYTVAEIIGRDGTIIIPPESEAVAAQKRALLQQGRPVPPFDTVRLTKDGRRIDVSVSQSPINDASGKMIGVSLVFRDISERKSQELKIARLSRIQAVLSGINSAIVRIRDRQQLFEESCRIATEHGKFTMSWIGMLDEAAQAIRPVARMGRDEGYLERLNLTIASDKTGNLAMAVEALGLRAPVVCNDIATDGRMRPWRAAALERGYRSSAIFPLLLEQQAVGVLVLYAPEPGFFDEAEMKLLTELAGDISFALDHIAGQESIEKLTRIRLISSEINSAIVRIRDRHRLFAETCRIAVEHGGFGIAWIGTLNTKTQEITPVASYGIEAESYLAHARNTASTGLKLGGGVAGRAVREKRAVFSNDLLAETSLGGERRKEAIRRGYRSVIVLPFLVEGSVVGNLSLFAREAGFFDDEEVKLLNELADDISFALEHIGKEEKLNYLAYYDVLTGLPNRTLFIDRLDQRISAARDGQQMFSVMMLDIERFRLVNDTLGRQAGDDLLRQISQRLKNAFQNVDLLANFGGDIFAIATRRTKESAVIVHLLEKILTVLSGEPFKVGGSELRVAARVGAAVYPADGTDVDVLLKNAEAALENAKTTGHRYVYYAPQMNARAAEQLQLENELRRAILEEQFVLHYQQRVDLASGRISGMEALIRWAHPRRGLVPPGEFIPILENTGLIFEAGRWALKRAALDHAAWRAQGLKPPRIAVNISAIHLQRKEFVEDVRTSVVAAEDFEHIDIEITESMLMVDLEGNIEKLKAVQAMGMLVAMDDFGTGYSSLSYLARLPINSLKVDRSFISQMAKGPEQMAIVTAVISLGRALNLKVVAEGVETEEQANLLRLLHCDEAQGYLFGRPVPSGKFVELLRQDGTAAKPVK